MKPKIYLILLNYATFPKQEK